MRTKITLACTECKQRNYNTTKEKKTHPDRMEIKKYCRFCRTHTLHKETKQTIGFVRRDTMADSAKTEAKKDSFWKSVKTEFKKIAWPDQKETVKQSVAVLCVSVVVGLIITFLDTLIQFGINFLTSIGV